MTEKQSKECLSLLRQIVALKRLKSNLDVFGEDKTTGRTFDKYHRRQTVWEEAMIFLDGITE